MACSRKSSFDLMKKFFRIWLEGARHRDLLSLLELIREELRRRSYTLAYRVTKKGPDRD